MKIAIVGSGIAGLASAHFLRKRGCEVDLFESQSQLGMSAQTIDIPVPNDDSMVLGDVPSRMYNSQLWPSVVDLYQSIGVETKPVQGKQCYRVGPSGDPLVMSLPFDWKSELLGIAGEVAGEIAGKVSSVIGWGSESKMDPSVASDPSNHSVSLNTQRRSFLGELNRLREQGARDLESIDPQMSFVDYLDRHQFSETFRHAFLYPALSSTVCTCSHEAISNYPAAILLNAMNHIAGSEGLSRAAGGTRLVANQLVADGVNVRLQTAVESVQRDNDKVLLRTAAGAEQFYQHVIIASQANKAAEILPGIGEFERATLNGFRYEDVEVIVHTDDGVMPSERRDWSVFNFEASERGDESMCTVWMNRFHDDWEESGFKQSIFQTIRPIRSINSESVIRRIALQRPVVDDRSWRLWENLRAINGQESRRIWFCGSYAMPGIPLLESAVQSALEVADGVTR